MKTKLKNTLWSALSPIDRATLFYISLTGLYILAGASSLQNILPHIAARVGIVILMFGLIFSEKRSRQKQVKEFSTLGRNVYQIFLFSFFYSETAYMKNIVFTNNLDTYVASFEQNIFGFQPSLVFSARFGQDWFRELMSLCYFSFYVFVPIFCLLIYFHKRQIASKVIFIVTFSFYIFYLMYDFIPVLGPQYFYNTIPTDAPPTYFFGKIMRYILLNIEDPTGAFPSSHVGLAFISCILAYKYYRRVFYYILPFSAGICFATVYLKEHYLIDVLAAIVLAPLFIYISNLVYNRLILLNTLPKEKLSNIDEKAYFCRKF